MKNIWKLMFFFAFILVLSGCGNGETYDIEIIIPAGSKEAFIYSDEEIRPTGNQITIRSGAGLGDTEVILKPVNENVETGFVGEYLTHGVPVKFDTRGVKEEWFKIGVSVQNDSDKAKTVCVEVEGAEVRIAEPEESEIIVYNGKEYKKSELCNATLQWLKLSEEERLFSSYMPPEFVEFVDTWGITLTLENVSAEGGVIKCTQSGGEPTGELQTGSWYIVEEWTKEKGWSEVPYVIDGEIGWTSEAWMIPKENTCEWEANWKWLYGALPSGKYRIGKEIMDFRGPGDFDNAIYFAEFTIE